MSKTNKELISELTIAFLTSWNGKTNTQALKEDDVKSIYNMFKDLVESTSDN